LQNPGKVTKQHSQQTKKGFKSTSKQAKKKAGTALARKLVVGDRISVFWEEKDHNCWYDGTISEEKPNRLKRFRLSYDDGDEEWINPNNETIKRAKKIREDKDSPESDTKNEANDRPRRTPRSGKIPSFTGKLSVGDRISIFSKDFNRFLDAVVRQKRPKYKTNVRVMYDDGRERWINPNIERIVFLQANKEEGNSRDQTGEERDEVISSDTCFLLAYMLT